ncbi:MAG: hypothetical protein ABGY24_00870 [bacterium]
MSEGDDAHRAQLTSQTRCADKHPYLIEDPVRPNVTFSILTDVSKEETQAERVVLVARHP